MTDPRRLILGLIGFQAIDAVACAVPNGYVQRDLERLQVPEALCRAIPVVKAASVAGLALGLRHPRLGRLTATALVGYFVAALGAHVRVHDAAWRYAPAAGMLGWSVAAVRAYGGQPSS